VSGSADEIDRRWMREALQLAARAAGSTAPNPLVGSVVVKDGQCLASGYHVRAGRPHGEAVALRRAGEAARGATLYVNLEPCAHHGRTPPCVEAVLERGVARVVIGMRDPDPRTAGRSIRRLRRAGVEVRTGVEVEAARALNRGFVSRVERGRPYTTLKLAASWDGRVATASGQSRWITGPHARAWVHRLRARVDAIAVGSRTALLDDPELTARPSGRIVHRPQRIVIDSGLTLPPRSRMVDTAHPVWVFARKDADPRKRRALERRGARILAAPARAGHLDLGRVWERLGELGVNDLLVEGGGELAAALLRAGLVDLLYLFQAPLLLGATGRPAIGDLRVRLLERAPRPARWDLERIGDDLLIRAEW